MAQTTYTVGASIFHEILRHLRGRHGTNAVRCGQSGGGGRSALVGGELERFEQSEAVLASLDGACLHHGGRDLLGLNKLAHCWGFGLDGTFQDVRTIQFGFASV